MTILLKIAYIVSIIATTLSIIFVKKYTMTQNFMWIIYALICSALVIWSFIIILPSGRMFVLYPIIKILTILLIAIIGHIYFNEKLNTLSFIGIILSIISIYILSISS
jgi:multidrug transporter EmrE-like cation transporter